MRQQAAWAYPEQVDNDILPHVCVFNWAFAWRGAKGQPEKPVRLRVMPGRK